MRWPCCASQRLSVEDQTEHYVVNLLTLFSRSEALFDRTAEGPRLKPLVVMLCEALEAPSADDRNRNLQRLGDVSLFVAGFFAQSFARKLIDIDYHIAMGGRAYGVLAETLARGSPSWSAARVKLLHCAMRKKILRWSSRSMIVRDSWMV